MIASETVSVLCPFCGQPVELLIDTTIPHQQYVEDCEVCCNPMEFSMRCAEGILLEFEVQQLGQ